MWYLLLFVLQCEAIDQQTTSTISREENECQKGCFICGREIQNQCQACQQNKITSELKGTCGCLNSYLQYYPNCLSYQQALNLKKILYSIEDEHFMVIQIFEVSVLGDTYDYNGFSFLRCEELLTQTVINQLLNAQIYRVLLIIQFQEQILDLWCAQLNISTIFQFIKIPSTLVSKTEYNQVQLSAETVEIYLNNNPPPNQTLVIFSNVVTLHNLYINEDIYRFQLMISGLTNTILLYLDNITLINVNYQSMILITIYDDIQSNIEINSIQIIQSNISDINILVATKENNGHIIKFRNLIIQQSVLNNFNIFAFQAESLIIENVRINLSLIENSLIFNSFINLQAFNISTMNSTIVDSVFIVVMAMIPVQEIIISNFLISETTLSSSRILQYQQTKQLGNLIIIGLKLNNLTILDSQLEQFVILNAFAVQLNDIHMSNINMYPTYIIIMDRINTLHLTNIFIEKVTFVTNDQINALMAFKDCTNYYFQKILIHNIISNGYIIAISSSHTVLFIISDLQIFNITTNQYLYIYCQDTFMQFDYLTLKQQRIIPLQDLKPEEFIIIEGQSIQILNSIFEFINEMLSISAESISITQCQFTSVLDLFELLISSQQINLSNNRFVNITLKIKDFDTGNLQTSQLELMNNHFITLNKQNSYVWIIQIEDMNVLIDSNIFQIQTMGCIFVIQANFHQIIFINNIFRNNSAYIILKTEFTINTMLTLNQTIISNTKLNLNAQPFKIETQDSLSYFNIEYANQVIIHDLLIVNQQHTAFILQKLQIVFLQNIQIQSNLMHLDCIVLNNVQSAKIENLLFTNIKVLSDQKQNIRSLIFIESNIFKSEITINKMIIQEVNANYLLTIITKSKMNINIQNLQLINNKCTILCVYLQSKKVSQLQIRKLIAKGNMAPLIIKFELQENSNIEINEIFIDNMAGVVSIVSQSFLPISSSEIYERFMIQGQLMFVNLIRDQYNQGSSFQTPIVVSFNNGNTFQKSIPQSNTRIALVQFEGRGSRKQQYLYVPAYGYSLSNYSRLNKQDMVYEQYKLDLSIQINYYHYTENDCKCHINGNDQQIVIHHLQQTLKDFIINFYEPNLIEFNIKCQFDQPFSLIFYAKQFKCQIGEINKTNICIPCARDQYSVSKNDRLCKDRDPQLMKSVMMGLIELRKGFWRSDFNTDEIEPCLIWLDSCKGGFKFGDQSCEDGYIGSTCFECDKELQSYRQIDGTCGNRQNSMLIYIFIWILLSIFLLNTNVQSNLKYWQSRRTFILMYQKFSKICLQEKINIVSALFVFLMEYQQFSSLFSDRYTNSSYKINQFVYLLSYTVNAPFLVLDHVLSSYFNPSDWLFYRSIFFIVASCFILNIYLIRVTTEWKFNFKRYQFQIIALICYYFLQMIIFIHIKQLFELVTPVRLSNKIFIYHQMDVQFTPHISEILRFVLFNVIIVAIIIFCTSQIYEKQRLFTWNGNQRILNVNTLITLASVILLTQQYIYRLFFSIIYVEITMILIRKQLIYHNTKLMRLKIFLIRMLAFQIMINSLINLSEQEWHIIILSYLNLILWIGINSQIIIEIINLYLSRKVPDQRLQQLNYKLKDAKKRFTRD